MRVIESERKIVYYDDNDDDNDSLCRKGYYCIQRYSTVMEKF